MDRINLKNSCRVAVLLVLVCLATVASAVEYATELDGNRLSLACEDAAAVDTPCRIGTKDNPSVMEVRFGSGRTRYAHLLKRGIEKTIAEPGNPAKFGEPEIRFLRALALEQCHDAVEPGPAAWDTLQLCRPADDSRVVLFMRGLCDRCEFTPVIMKREGAR